ncbi:GNAT family N-acetyltransferase [Winogradskyella immobilis]|uniref:GNAT family N-acetyltransferase n=1 Tax=Winogradskyella immobilis TaxID=2816852 RepID=A0ABS8EQD3_9FLAO|nr:GNAT family N-acetyltransferase [Winogradskyella immobilis]MCC1485449.1 GNAT family N-acetyltransferase [Winogradskyella immobilis]MCG0017541.1 GNAT family N-acetyltransferase [Winogradskyella immobilis]
MSAFKIETKRLILRHLTHSDVNGMFELDSNPIVHKYLGNNPITTLKEAEKNIRSNIRQHKERGIARWATIEKSSGEFVGWSGLRLNSDLTYNNRTNFYDIGYRFIPRYWGKGYATESSIVALDYFFNTMKKDILFGIAETTNIASNKILRRIGLKFINDFKIDGIDAKWYELKKEDYAKTMS